MQLFSCCISFFAPIAFRARRVVRRIIKGDPVTREELLKDLTEEQIEKVKACKNQEEILICRRNWFTRFWLNIGIHIDRSLGGAFLTPRAPFKCKLHFKIAL